MSYSNIFILSVITNNKLVVKNIVKEQKYLENNIEVDNKRIKIHKENE